MQCTFHELLLLVQVNGWNVLRELGVFFLAIRFSLRRFSLPWFSLDFSVWDVSVSNCFSLEIFSLKIFSLRRFSLRLFQSWNFQSQIFQSETFQSWGFKFFLQLLVELRLVAFFSPQNWGKVAFDNLNFEVMLSLLISKLRLCCLC